MYQVSFPDPVKSGIWTGSPTSLCTEMYSRFDSANISKVSTFKLLQLEIKKTNRAIKEAAVIAVLADVEGGGGG